jgi:hypothetical protein
VAPGDSRDRLRVTLFAFCLHFFHFLGRLKKHKFLWFFHRYSYYVYRLKKHNTPIQYFINISSTIGET